jgi:hypothetical protein
MLLHQMQNLFVCDEFFSLSLLFQPIKNESIEIYLFDWMKSIDRLEEGKKQMTSLFDTLIDLH